MDVCHNSHDLNDRTPFGAVPAGTAVTLSLTVTPAPETCRLVLWRDGAPKENIPMTPDAGKPGRFSVTVSMPAKPALLWYYFAFQDAGGHAYYYGNNAAAFGGIGQLSGEPPAPYQITVYAEDSVPEWYKDGVVYQIFPDRFFRGADWDTRRKAAAHPDGWTGAKRVFQEDWTDAPFYTKNARGDVTRWPFFGGTLEGIRSKLLYLKSLGVSAVYLNPIFEAASNHKYDTADYTKIDPGFGDVASFRALADDARAFGIRLILDGVFAHTGADSVYFDKYGNYGNSGACQGPSSPYYGWYRFDSFPDKYDSWWGVADLPKTDKENANYRGFIYGGASSVVRRWLAFGAAGWRLDVADELPDDFIQGIRRAIDETAPDSVLLGEVWEDASSKISYGIRRTYLLGGALQSVTNYPFREAALDYMLGRIGAPELAERLMSLRENYPPEQFSAALNLIGSHDRVRVMTVLGDAPDGLTDIEKQGYTLPPDKYALAKARLKLLSLLQFTMGGVPCVYYGDEAGVQGFEDPYNRAPFPWGREDEELRTHYRMLGLLRGQYKALREGDILPEGLTSHVFSLRRRDGDDEIRLIVNRGIFEHETVDIPTDAGFILDLLSAEELRPENGRLALRFEPLTARLLCLKKAPPELLPLKRSFGILCALGSVPAKTPGAPAPMDVYRFVDFLAGCSAKLWQLLPLNPAGKGGSPFYSPSLFALGGTLADEGAPIDGEGLEAFCQLNTYWLDDGALFAALKAKNGGRPWPSWPEDERLRRDVPTLMKIHADAVSRWKETQYRRHRAWLAVKKYAGSRGISIVGDLPVYAAPDSADVWAHQELFRLGKSGAAERSYARLHAGVPPDYFTPEGQDWGNPLYNWDGETAGVYLFWENRLRRALDLYDTVRLDHFRSFSAYFAIPDGAPPSEGQWLYGAGIGFFNEMRARLGSLPLIAEDLGVLDTPVRCLVKLSGLPGMNVWQFSGEEMAAMSAEEASRRVFYSGTHDNQTLAGWCRDAYPEENPAEKADEIIGRLFASKAPWVILPLQDILGLGDEARMNTPGTSSGNWHWCADGKSLTPEIEAKFRRLARSNGR